MDEPADRGPGRLQADKVRRNVLRGFQRRPHPERTHALAQLLLDEFHRVEGGVAEEDVEGERRVDLPHVFKVLLGVVDEDVLALEADERRAVQLRALGEQLADVVPVDLGGPLEGEVRDAEPFQLRGVARPGVPAHVMAGGLEVHRDAGERVEVAIERHGGEQDFHESVFLSSSFI